MRKKFYNNKKKRPVEDAYVPNYPKEVLDKPIAELGLSQSVLDTLTKGGVATVGDIAKRRMREMYRIQNIGKKQCFEILNKLKLLGVEFRAEEQAPTPAEQNNAGKGEPKQNGGKQVKDKQGKNKQDRQIFQQKPGNVAETQTKEKRNHDKKVKKLDGVNKSLNDSLSKMYAGMTINEIIMGKRVRPNFAQEPVKQKLTPDSIVKFCRKGKWGYKDWKGNVLIQPTFQEAFQFSEGLACVEKDEKLGFIDTKGEIVIDYQFDAACSFSEGVAVATINEKTGYIDKEGQWVIQPMYDIATPFVDGKAVVMLDKRWGVLSHDGNVFWR